ncbi:MAG: MFS transporter [Verrucomicrobia bacterium]|nr:MFS transporter [Verrucomicrobiota bacterium]
MTRKNQAVMAWVIWILTAAFYFYEFVIRVAPSVMVSELMDAFAVDAATLGVLSASYLYIYAPMQIPVGLLIDRFGARRLLTFASAICGLGGIIFGFAVNLGLADVGRVLMGLGSAFAYVGLVYVSSRWFSPKRLPFLIGLGTSIGMLGAMGGQDPVSFFVSLVGWRMTSIGLGILGLFLALIIYLSVRATPVFGKHKVIANESVNTIWHNLKAVASNWQTWIVCVISAGMYATTGAFAGLWAPAFFQSSYGMSKELAAAVTSTFYLGYVIGSPLISYIAMKVSRRRPYLQGGSVAGLLLISSLIWPPYDMPLWLLIALSTLCGLASSTQVLTFTIAIEVNEKKAHATAAAFVNFLVMITVSWLQPFVGALLDFSHNNFRLALSLFPASFLIAILASLLLNKHNILHTKEVA